MYRKFDDLWEFEERGYFKYTTGCAKDYNEIVEHLKTVKVVIKDAFVVAFQDGKKINLSEARQLTNN